MTTPWIRLFFGTTSLLLSLLLRASATVYYVNAANPAPASPFTSWDTAATNIQDAINLTTSAADTVLVTNGVYAYGGLVMAGDLLNRVALTNAITVQSVNGPWVTTILGAGATNGSSAVRCAWLTNGASLSGFTLMAGGTRTSGNAATLELGGGVWCASSNAVVANCVIASNTAYASGGGIYQGTLKNSLLISNGCYSASGAAADSLLLNDCTIVSNAAIGVLFPLAMTNCIIYFNGSGGTYNYEASGRAFSHCCTTPALSGTSNFTTAPQLFADAVHLLSNSPCIGAGINFGVTGTDLFGNAWSNPPAVGCAEWTPALLVSAPHTSLTANPIGFTVNAALVNAANSAFFWLKDGMPLQDNGHFSGTQTTNLIVTGINFTDGGNYQLVVSNSFGVVTSSVAAPGLHYVNAAGANPVPPYDTWQTAATTIQDAISASASGEIVLVTNGVYASGGISMDGVITNRVSMNKAILVQSVNGANATTIQGAWDPATNGPAAIRCVWLSTNAILGGFTVSGGATRAGVSGTAYSGGGVSAIGSVTVANCTLQNNAAALGGGGVWGSANLFNCVLRGNRVLGGNGSGGGAYHCSLNNCIITGNYAVYQGGGVDYCTVKNSAILTNSAGVQGGGVYQGTLLNCTITGNSTTGFSYDYGGGVSTATLTNCIAYGNSETGSAGLASNYSQCTFSYSCAYPLPAGTGNLSANPQLLADGFHLAAASPCIGAGTTNSVNGTDIDGQPWNNPPSMGCDEWNPTPLTFGPPSVLIGTPPHALTWNAAVAGQAPFVCSWTHNGVPLQDNGHYSNSATASLVVNNFGPDDAGAYQVTVTNVVGAATSAVAQVVIHAVNAAATGSLPPYASWATAAATIQDAVNVAAAGDIVLVTNGVYANGGLAINGLTNRVALTLPLTVMSFNGFDATVIQGAFDPVSTNGPAAIRCAYLADGAILNGFTLCNGATPNSGGGIYCNSVNGLATGCVLSNNSAVYGGGMANGTLNNSLVVNNHAAYNGGGAYYGVLNNCTVCNNSAGGFFGVGTYYSSAYNSIVINNYGLNYQFIGQDQYYYSCSDPPLGNNGNIDVNPEFLDWYRIPMNSPCCGAGSAAYASGYDLDGQSWNNPPSMGCSEVVPANLAGPLFVSIQSGTNGLVNHSFGCTGVVMGRASWVQWSYGDGVIASNTGVSGSHVWTNAGNYPVTFTAFNNDNPGGICATTLVSVQSLVSPQLQTPVLTTNGLQFQFAGQAYASYFIAFTTNLVPPINWQNLVFLGGATQAGTQTFLDTAATNTTRFYRVSAQ